MDTEERFVGIVVHGPAEKGLARFATKAAEMVTFSLVATNFAYFEIGLAGVDRFRYIFFVTGAERT